MCLLKAVHGTPGSADSLLVTFLETCQLRCQPLSIEFILIVVCQFFIYPLHSQFEKSASRSQECLFLVEVLF